jgi:hypothetical protein
VIKVTTCFADLLHRDRGNLRGLDSIVRLGLHRILQQDSLEPTVPVGANILVDGLRDPHGLPRHTSTYKYNAKLSLLTTIARECVIE